jgi:hypothetical protein
MAKANFLQASGYLLDKSTQCIQIACGHRANDLINNHMSKIPWVIRQQVNWTMRLPQSLIMRPSDAAGVRNQTYKEA